jgi:hypothetical protein
MPKVGGIYTINALQKRDGRTREARLVKRLRNELVAHIGGAPSVMESAAIDQVCEIALRIAIGGAQDIRSYLDASARLTLLLQDLGVTSETGGERVNTSIMRGQYHEVAA